MSFLRDRSPVTPKITRPQGPPIRWGLLARSSRNGLRVAVCHGLGGVTGCTAPYSNCWSRRPEHLPEALEALRAVDEVQSQHRAPVVGEHLGVAGRLGRDELA